MNTVRLVVNGRTLIEEGEQVVRLGDRLRGLLGRDSLGRGRAVHLCPCSAVHTFFMRFNLDLVFLSADLRVVRTARDVPPCRTAWGGLAARSVIELESGWFPKDALVPGDVISLESGEAS